MADRPDNCTCGGEFILKGQKRIMNQESCEYHSSPPPPEVVNFMALLQVAVNASQEDFDRDNKYRDYVGLNAYIRYEHLAEVLRTYDETYRKPVLPSEEWDI